MVLKIKLLVALFIAVTCLQCRSLPYYDQAINGQLEIMRNREPISDLVEDPETPARLRNKLIFIQNVRDFAAKELQLPVDDRHTYSRNYLTGSIAVLMGGRVAEELVLNQMTTGAGNVFDRATEMARKMVCEWGMSEKLGPLTFGKQEEQIFLGREIAQHRDYSEATAVIIDAVATTWLAPGWTAWRPRVCGPSGSFRCSPPRPFPTTIPWSPACFPITTGLSTTAFMRMTWAVYTGSGMQKWLPILMP